MKPAVIIGAVVAVAVLLFGVYVLDVDMTKEASLPDVDVSVEGGNLPEFEVEAGEIETGTTEVEMTVPTIEVNPPEEDTQTASNN